MIRSVLRVLWHKGPMGLLKTFYYVAKIAFYRRIIGERYIKKQIHDYSMYLDINDVGISRTLLLFGNREKDHHIILKNVLSKGMKVFDFGANIGYYALMESRLVGPTGVVVAVEPSPENVALLKRNVTLNKVENIPIMAVGVSERRTRQTLLLAHMSNLNTFHAPGLDPKSLSGKTIEVEVLGVPDIAAEHGAPDLIRMDVEGHEVEIFNGMLEDVEAGRMSPMILFEVHRQRYGPDHDMVRPMQRLLNCGYRPRFVASSSAGGTKIINDLGYKGGTPFRTDFMTRAIFEDVSGEHLIDLMCRTGGVRTVLLAKQD